MTTLKNDNLDQDIKEVGANLREIADQQLRATMDAYWAAHKELAETSFTSRWEMLRAIRKLGQLGIAAHDMGKAVTAINEVRCH